LKILTIDLEDWFHILDHKGTSYENDWVKYPSRIRQGMDLLLGILDDTHTPATFFVIGWMARKYPEIVRQLDLSGYEIACQGDLHRLVYAMGPVEFRQDTQNAISHIEDIIGKKVTGYRAPGFSITEATPWAFEILAEAGITYDSSVFPARRAHGGYPDFTSHHPCMIKINPSFNSSFQTPNSSFIKEFPITTTTFLGKDIVFCGGGYFRLFPYPLTKRWTKQQESYLMAYIHPRDVDPGQPTLPGLSPLRLFKSYYGIKGAEQKLRKWLTDFQFTDILTFDKNFDWKKAPVVELINK